MASTRPPPLPMTIHRDALGPCSRTSPKATSTASATATDNSPAASPPAPAKATATPKTARSSTSFRTTPTSSNPLEPATGNLQSIMFRPPIVGPSASPSKRRHHQPSTGQDENSPQQQSQKSSSSLPITVFRNSFDRISMPPPAQDAFVTDSPMKKPPVTVFDTSIHMPAMHSLHHHHHAQHKKPNAALFTQFQTSKAMANKENIGYDLMHSMGKIQKNNSIRRVLMEAAPIKEKKVLKEKNANTSSPSAAAAAAQAPPDPATWEPPAIADDGKKPPYSYATLIGMAILRADNQRLTLAQIYKWIGDTFAYYRTSNNGWQNSIRHNLSLNKAFMKQERPKDDPGKGNYWIIQKGCEQQFMKTKNSRKSGGSKKAKVPSSGTSAPISEDPSSKSLVKEAEAQAEAPELPLPLLSPILSSAHDINTTDTIDDCTAKGAIDELLALSSDATRSAGSVSPQPLRLLEDDDIFRPSSPQATVPGHSSPPHIMCSSPPLTRAQISQPTRDATSPPVFPASGPRKRKLSSMNDSGYYSSLESSILRPNGAAAAADEPRIKRGRAEEDIARIRQHESPTRRSATLPGNTSSSLLGTSSPLRNYDINPMLPPLTPATTLRPLQKTPRSVSPNTNLRLHRDRIRQLVKSPSRDIDILDDDPWGSTLAALACHDFAFEDDEIASMATRVCYSTPERNTEPIIKAESSVFGDSYFDTQDLFGVDIFGVMKNGFERFTNECPESPSAATTRPGLYKAHTAKF